MGIFLFAALSKQFPTGLCPFSSPDLMTRQLQYPRKRSGFLSTATCLAEKSTSNKWVKQCLKWTIAKKLIDKLKVFVTLHHVIEHIHWTLASLANKKTRLSLLEGQTKIDVKYLKIGPTISLPKPRPSTKTHQDSIRKFGCSGKKREVSTHYDKGKASKYKENSYTISIHISVCIYIYIHRDCWYSQVPKAKLDVFCSLPGHRSKKLSETPHEKPSIFTQQMVLFQWLLHPSESPRSHGA